MDGVLDHQSNPDGGGEVVNLTDLCWVKIAHGLRHTRFDEGQVSLRDAAQIAAPAGGEIVDHDRMVASAHQVFNEMRPDEAGATRDQ